MKTCPNCKTTYTDDSLAFCLQDGSQLVTFFDEPETVISARNQFGVNQQSNSSFNNTPNNWSNPELQEPKKSRTMLIVFATIFLTVLLIGGVGIGVWMFAKNNTQPQVVQNTNVNVAKPNVNIATPTATPTPKPTINPTEVTGIKKDVENVIMDWKTASEDFDLETNISNYADTVDYYKGGKVNKSKIKQDKDKAYKLYDTISIKLSDIKITPDSSGEKATAVFNKEWDFANEERVNRGEVQQQIIFSKIGGKWKIVSEKDLKVLWTDRGDQPNDAKDDLSVPDEEK